MSSMDVAVNEHSANFEEENSNDLRNPDIVQKYRIAGEIANEVMKTVAAAATVGRRVVELCDLGDEQINVRTEKVFNKGKVEKGLAFPTCISVNHIVGHYSPLAEATDALAAGDVVKIALGVHVDGYIAQIAHTIVVAAEGQTEAIQGRAADVVLAAYTAAEAALRTLKAGNHNHQVTEVINKVAQAYHCTPLEGVLSHQLKRFILDSDKVIMNRLDSENSVEEAVFEEGDAFSIDVVMSTGDGTAREGESRTTVFARNTDTAYSLKLKASRFLFSEINRRFPALPFSLRAVDEDKRGRLGIVEMVNHELVRGFPVLYERQGEFVAHVQFTAIITASGTHRLTSAPLPANISSTYAVEDEEVKALLATSAAPKKKKANKKRKEGEAVKEDEN